VAMAQEDPQKMAQEDPQNLPAVLFFLKVNVGVNIYHVCQVRSHTMDYVIAMDQPMNAWKMLDVMALMLSLLAILQDALPINVREM